MYQIAPVKSHLPGTLVRKAPTLSLLVSHRLTSTVTTGMIMPTLSTIETGCAATAAPGPG